MARNERQSRGRRRAAVENIKALFKEFNEERLALRRLWCERLMGADYAAINFNGLVDAIEARSVEEMLMWY